jgi:ornithine carbamoyltransferase
MIAMGTATAVYSAVSDLLTGLEWTPAEVSELLELAARLKARPERFRRSLRGKFIALIFEKPSLRTRVTFEVGAAGLGATAIFLDYTGTRLGEREALCDVARNLERWVHAMAARTYAQQTLEELARCAAVPVINALSDRFHPCQALADAFTLQERFGGLQGLPVAYVGDGNNVCHSLLVMAAQTGLSLRVATPPGYGPDPEVVSRARAIAAQTGAQLALFHAPEQAVRDARAVYTDVWASMGQEHEAEHRRRVFAPFQVTPRLMELAAPGAVFLHCLPAHRGEEVVAEVLESPQSLVFEQAENRLHTARAVLLKLLG